MVAVLVKHEDVDNEVPQTRKVYRISVRLAHRERAGPGEPEPG